MYFRDPNKKLWEYAKKGDEKGVRNMIRKGGVVNWINEADKSSTPLLKAVERGKLEVVKLLLEKGAEVSARNAQQDTSLHVAVMLENKDMSELLLDNKADVNAAGAKNNTPLHNAIMIGNVDVARLLLDKAANVDARNAKMETPLHIAARGTEIKAADVLVRYGANVNARIDNSEIYFESDTEREIVNTVRSRIGENARIYCRLRYYCTPLQDAVYFARAEFALLLLENGADVSISNKLRQTVLHSAVDAAHYEAFNLLVEYGADIHALDVEDKSPLYYAIFQGIKTGKDEVALYLLAHGASIQYKNDVGQTLLCEAIKSQSESNAHALLKHGANPNETVEYKPVTRYASESSIADNLVPVVTSFTNLENAIDSQDGEIVQGYLRQSIVNRSEDDMKEKYKEVKSATCPLNDSKWKSTLESVLNDHKVEMLYFAFVTDDTDKRDAIIGWIDKDKKWIQNAKFSDGSTLMQRAVKFQNMAALGHMICYGIEPYEACNHNLLVSETAENEKLKEKTRDKILETMKTEYTKYARTLIGSEDVTNLSHDELIKLALFYSTCMTEVILVMNFAVCYIKGKKLIQLIPEGLEMSTRRRFVYENNDRKLFTNLIAKLEKQKLLDYENLLNFQAEMTKVNTENSDWVCRMKATIKKLDIGLSATKRDIQTFRDNFNALVAALNEKEEREVRNKKIRLAISFTCISLVLVGGPIIKELLEAVVFVNDPTHVLTAMQDIGEGVVKDFLINEGIKHVLEEACIRPDDFVANLRSAEIKLNTESEFCFSKAIPDEDDVHSGNTSSICSSTAEEQSESMNKKDDKDNSSTKDCQSKVKDLTSENKASNHEDMEIDLEVNPLSTPDADNTMPEERVTREEMKDESDDYGSTDTHAVTVLPTFVDASKITKKNYRSHPFHEAVLKSAGDKKQFAEYAESIVADGFSINDTMRVTVREDLSEDWEEKECSAAIFASYLGYRNVVNWFFEQDDFQKIEATFTTNCRLDQVADVFQK